jgi:succinate dehydrogenase assembly factor 1
LHCFLGFRLTRSSAEFRKQLEVNKKDFATIEHLLRKGHRQLEMYSSPGIRDISW